MPDSLQELFEAAVVLEGDARERFLDRCDPALRSDLRALLAADRRAESNEGWGRSALEHESRATSHSSDPVIGQTIGPYRIVSVIGAGGMGKVYRAVRADAEFEQSVAIKRIRIGLDADQVVARFRAERKILARLEHPNIARLLDGGAGPDGLPYLIMEYIEGLPPMTFADAQHLSLEARLGLFRQICAAVHYAHQRMVIHRDLKPGNILVTATGEPKLLDFGLAKVLQPDPTSDPFPVTETGMHFMTVRYASPEQVRGEPATTASDIYSLGVLLYELLTGHSPYPDPDVAAPNLMRVVCESAPPAPSTWNRELRGDLDNILLKTLEKDPARRYASADQLSDDIRRYLEGLPVLARGDTMSYVLAKFVRRHRIAVAAAILVVATLAASLVIVSRARARAERRFNDVRRLAHSVVFDYHDAIEHLPGSTPVRKRLVEDALRYLDSLSAEADDPALQRELVDAYVRISNVQGDSYHDNLGDITGARESARKAVAAAERLLARDRGPGSLRSAAAAFGVAGSLAYAAGDLKAAGEKLRRAVELGESAAALAPGDVDSGSELAQNLRHLGDLYGGGGNMLNIGRSGDSLAYYQRAEGVIRSLAAMQPANPRLQRELHQTLQLLSGAAASQGKPADAAKYLGEAVGIIESIVARDPGSTSDQFELASVTLRRAILLRDDGKASEAVPLVARSAEVLQRLIAADPKNALYRRSLSVTENQYATTLRGAGDVRGALPHNERSLALATELAKADPKSAEYRSDVAISERKLAETLLAAGNAAAAIEHATRSTDVLCAATGDPYQEAHCDRALLLIGDAQADLHQNSAAKDSYQKAEKNALKLSQADPSNTVLKDDLNRCRKRLDRGY